MIDLRKVQLFDSHSELVNHSEQLSQENKRLSSAVFALLVLSIALIANHAKKEYFQKKENQIIL